MTMMKDMEESVGIALATRDKRKRARRENDCSSFCSQNKKIVFLEDQIEINTKAIDTMQGIISHQQSTLETICANVGIIANGHTESSKLLKELHGDTAEIVGIMKTAKGVRSMAIFTLPYFAFATVMIGAITAMWTLIIRFIKEPL